MAGRMTSCTVLQISAQSLVGILLAHFLEVPPLGLPAPFLAEDTGSPDYSMPCGELGKGHLLELRSLKIHTTETQQNCIWAPRQNFLSPLSHTTEYLNKCNKRPLVVSFLEHRFRGHTLHLLLITFWLFYLWTCFKRTPILDGLQGCLPLCCYKLLHVP